jgi:hypothetical protein
MVGIVERPRSWIEEYSGGFLERDVMLAKVCRSLARVPCVGHAGTLALEVLPLHVLGGLTTDASVARGRARSAMTSSFPAGPLQALVRRQRRNKACLGYAIHGTTP